jgi:hypothetical protein
MVHRSNFDVHGNYRHRTVATHTSHAEPEIFDVYEYSDYLDVVNDILDAHNPDVVNQIYEVQALEASQTLQDYELLKTFFARATADTIKRTISVTTQNTQGRVSDNVWQHWKSHFPEGNFNSCNEAVVTNTVFRDTPAVFTSGIKAAQIFIGRKSLVADVYGIKTDYEFVNTLEDIIRKQGSMDKIISNCARVETSTFIKDILKAIINSKLEELTIPEKSELYREPLRHYQGCHESGY